MMSFKAMSLVVAAHEIEQMNQQQPKKQQQLQQTYNRMMYFVGVLSIWFSCDFFFFRQITENAKSRNIA